MVRTDIPLTGAENPKDALGSKKLPLALWPSTALVVGSLGLYEGLLKYGKTNYRAVEVIASIYLDACNRHIKAWEEGEYADVKTLVPHLGNALACLAIIVDAEAAGTLIDDRPCPSNGYFKLREELTPVVEHLQKLFADNKPTQYTRKWADKEAYNRDADIANTTQVTIDVDRDIANMLHDTDIPYDTVLSYGVAAMRKEAQEQAARVIQAREAEKPMRHVANAREGGKAFVEFMNTDNLHTQTAPAKSRVKRKAKKKTRKAR